MPITVVPGASVILSYSKDGAEAPASFREELAAAATRVSELIQGEGASVHEVNAAQSWDIDTEEILDQASGVVVLGGADIDPSTYGQPRSAENLYYVDTAADRFEIALVQGAVKRGLPVLGICRGSQIANVALGGSLVQDLGVGLHNREIVGDPWTDHTVELAPNTMLREMLGEDRIIVRTGHHQAVDRIGEGLLAAAHADDGVIEAIESEDRRVLGLQWHPEEALGDPAALQLIFERFVGATQRRAMVHE